MKWTSFFTALTFLGAACAYGQSIIPDSYLGARNAAMGSADMGEPHDLSSMYQNPATVALLETPSVFVNHVQGVDNEMQEDLAFPVVYTRSQMLAFGAEYYSLGELTKSTAATRYAVGYDVAFASQIASAMSVGGSVSFQRGYVPKMPSANASSYAFGFDYAPGKDVSYGLTLSGLGTGVEFVTANSIVTPVQTVLSRALEVSAVFRFPTETSLENPYLTMALASQKVFGLSGVNFMGGIEYFPIPALALRFGYGTGPSGTQQRYGLGLKAGLLELDLTAYPVKSGTSDSVFEQLSAAVEF
jgi:hypothetical protein